MSKASEAHHPELMSTQEAADLLAVSIAWLAQRRGDPPMFSGGPPYYRIGSNIRYQRADLLDYIESCKAAQRGQ